MTAFFDKETEYKNRCISVGRALMRVEANVSAGTWEHYLDVVLPSYGISKVRALAMIDMAKEANRLDEKKAAKREAAASAAL